MLNILKLLYLPCTWGFDQDIQLILPYGKDTKLAKAITLYNTVSRVMEYSKPGFTCLNDYLYLNRTYLLFIAKKPLPPVTRKF
jgi:hypothetical protein